MGAGVDATKGDWVSSLRLGLSQILLPVVSDELKKTVMMAIRSLRSMMTLSHQRYSCLKSLT